MVLPNSVSLLQIGSITTKPPTASPPYCNPEAPLNRYFPAFTSKWVHVPFPILDSNTCWTNFQQTVDNELHHGTSRLKTGTRTLLLEYLKSLVTNFSIVSVLIFCSKIDLFSVLAFALRLKLDIFFR
jgi:hypothetical protein